MVRVSSPPLEVCKDFRYKSTIQALDLGLIVMAISSSLKAQSQWLYAGVWAGIRQRQGRHKTVRDVPKLGKPTAVLWAALPGCPQTKPAFPLVALPFVPLPPPACPPQPRALALICILFRQRLQMAALGPCPAALLGKAFCMPPSWVRIHQ